MNTYSLDYIDDLYVRYIQDPNSVSDVWKRYFEEFSLAAQSEQLFAEQPEVAANSENSSTEPAPDALARRPYWIMRLLRQTVLTGGHLTPRLYVPKGVCAQVGVRFTGFAPKIQAMETLLVRTTAYFLLYIFDICASIVFSRYALRSRLCLYKSSIAMMSWIRTSDSSVDACVSMLLLVTDYCCST